VGNICFALKAEVEEMKAKKAKKAKKAGAAKLTAARVTSIGPGPCTGTMKVRLE
jgi:hypothetical protein